MKNATWNLGIPARFDASLPVDMELLRNSHFSGGTHLHEATFKSTMTAAPFLNRFSLRVKI